MELPSATWCLHLATCINKNDEARSQTKWPCDACQLLFSIPDVCFQGKVGVLIVADAHEKDGGQTSQSVRHLENVLERPHHRSIDLGPIWQYNAMGVMLAFFRCNKGVC